VHTEAIRAGCLDVIQPAEPYQCERRAAAALTFALPSKLPVVAGNAAAGLSLFAFDLGSGTPVVCGYTGANGGTEYDFYACTQSGLAGGSLVTADHILMTVVTARPPLISSHFPGQGGGAKVEVILNDATCP
jgi:hypothetical protein